MRPFSEREHVIYEAVIARGATPLIEGLQIKPNECRVYPLKPTTKILSILSDVQVQRMDSSRRKLDPLPLDLIAFTRAATARVITPTRGEIIPTAEFQADIYRWDTERNAREFLRGNNNVQAFYEIHPQLTFLA